MNYNDFIKYIEDIDFLSDKEKQEYAIKKLLDIPHEYIGFVIQEDKKRTWLNAVLILKRIGYPKNTAAISGLLFLMQDVNWPGSEEALRVLGEMDKKVVIPFLEDALCKANDEGDTMWIGGLYRVIEKLDITREEFHTSDHYDIFTIRDF